jgi:hypothetical protein
MDAVLAAVEWVRAEDRVEVRVVDVGVIDVRVVDVRWADGGVVGGLHGGAGFVGEGVVRAQIRVRSEILR